MGQSDRRRPREDDQDDDSQGDSQRRRVMADFARELCSEYELPAEERSKYWSIHR